MENAIEMIDVETFSKRMGISRATGFEWLRKKILVQGVDYIKVGRVVRIVWGQELVKRLLATCAVAVKGPSGAEKFFVDDVGRVPRPKLGTQINLDYVGK